MSFKQQHRKSFASWLDEHMKMGRTDMPGRIVVVMALLERLREVPNLVNADHVATSGMQLQDHNKFVACALKRFGIDSPLREFGRRSSNLGGWIGPLFVWLESCGFPSMNPSQREALLNMVEAVAAERLQIINEGKPLIARYNIGTVVAVVADILDQAQEKNRAKDVAQYLVGAKLQLKYGKGAVQPKNVNTPNRDEPADFHIGNAAIEVTVSPPDPRHLNQVTRILGNTGMDVWLLVRAIDREKWQNSIDATIAGQLRGRVVVTDLETFLGQNVSEIGKFEPTLIAATLTELFKVYNERWLPAAGGSGLRIISEDPEHN